MSKVICDVCGTTYPETATQCPICGCAKDSAVPTGAADEAGGSYSYVKGGRFSERNVRRRTSGSHSNDRRRPSGSRPSGNSRRTKPEEEEKSNLGLIIIVILLLIAIIAVVIHLAVRYLGPDDTSGNNTGGGSTSQTEQNANDKPDPTDPQPPVSIPCTGLELSHKVIQFVGAGSTESLAVQLAPDNTTDKVTYTSSDPAIASVDANGLVTAVGPGEATITVTCGSQTQTCKIKCSFSGGTGTENPPTPPAGEFDFEFNTNNKKDPATGFTDVSLSKKGETWNAYKKTNSVAANLITWTSDDPSVCTIDETGLVTAVGHGETQIHAQYNGVTHTCIIRCTFKDAAGDNGGDDPAPTGEYTISHTDVTLSLSGDGSSFKLKLLDSNKNAVDVTWTASKAGYVTISGNKITAIASTSGLKDRCITVSTTYEGVTYSCIIRVGQ